MLSLYNYCIGHLSLPTFGTGTYNLLCTNAICNYGLDASIRGGMQCPNIVNIDLDGRGCSHVTSLESMKASGALNLFIALTGGGIASIVCLLLTSTQCHASRLVILVVIQPPALIVKFSVSRWPFVHSCLLFDHLFVHVCNNFNLYGHYNWLL